VGKKTDGKNFRLRRGRGGENQRHVSNRPSRDSDCPWLGRASEGTDSRHGLGGQQGRAAQAGAKAGGAGRQDSWNSCCNRPRYSTLARGPARGRDYRTRQIHDVADAERHLDAAPPALRGWERSKTITSLIFPLGLGITFRNRLQSEENSTTQDRLLILNRKPKSCVLRGERALPTKVGG
jgi:hypothetical protein